MRAAAQVGKITFAVERQHFIGRNALDDFGFVFFAQIQEVFHRIVAA